MPHRMMILEKYRKFLESIPYNIIFQVNRTQSNAEIHIREVKIIVPKEDPPIEVKSKYVASVSFVAEIYNFLTQEERKNLFLIM